MSKLLLISDLLYLNDIIKVCHWLIKKYDIGLFKKLNLWITGYHGCKMVISCLSFKFHPLKLN